MSADAAISIDGLSKVYQLATASTSDSLQQAVLAALASPLRRFRQLRGTERSMTAFWALKDVSFQVPRGEVVGVVGRNGAGKSTLLKILSRIVEPTEGRVVLQGRVASLLEVGTGFHPELTGRENIYLNGAILGMRRREITAKFDEIVSFAEIDGFLDTPVKRYSSGMYVRLAFAVAAHLDPDVLVVDEVLAVGDAQFQQKCIGKMKDFAGNGGRTVVFVSHNMGALRALCTSAVYLHKGRLAGQGGVDDMIRSYMRSAESTGARGGTVSSSGIDLFEAGLYLSGDIEPVNVISFLQSCEVRIRMGARDGFSMFGLVVRVYDELGTLVSSLNSCEEGVPAFTLGPDQTFVYAVPKMSLMPGRYSVSILVHRPHDPHKYLEADAYFQFEVMSAVIPGGSWAYTPSHGLARFVDGCVLK